MFPEEGSYYAIDFQCLAVVGGEHFLGFVNYADQLPTRFVRRVKQTEDTFRATLRQNSQESSCIVEVRRLMCPLSTTLRCKSREGKAMSNKGKFAVLIGAILLGVAWSSTATPKVENFYEGKTIRIIVPFGPGGQYDLYARLFARHLGKSIPGNPKILVQNMPGAGGLVAANFIYKAKPDGLTLHIWYRDTLFLQLFKDPAAEFDVAKFSWIGNADSTTYVFAVNSNLPYTSVNDMVEIKEPLRIGSTGSGDAVYVRIFEKFMGAKIKIVSGYRGQAEIVLALRRGEVSGLAGSFSGISQWISQGNPLRMIVHGELPTPAPALANIPLDTDILPPEGKSIAEIWNIPQVLARPLVGPPGIPDSRLKLLRAAFENMLKGDDFLVEAKKLNLPIHYMGPEAIIQSINTLREKPPETIQAIKDLFKQ